MTPIKACRCDFGTRYLNRMSMKSKFYDHVIEYDYGNFKGLTTPMVDLGMYEFKDLNIEKITHAESFNNDNAEEVYELEYISTATKQLRIILDAKYENIIFT